MSLPGAAAPLLVIPAERMQDELQRAMARGTTEHPGRRDWILLGLCCFGWFALGTALLGLSFHLIDPDRAQAAFLGGLLVGNGGPAWTLILSHWVDSQG